MSCTPPSPAPRHHTPLADGAPDQETLQSAPTRPAPATVQRERIFFVCDVRAVVRPSWQAAAALRPRHGVPPPDTTCSPTTGGAPAAPPAAAPHLSYCTQCTTPDYMPSTVALHSRAAAARPPAHRSLQRKIWDAGNRSEASAKQFRKLFKSFENIFHKILATGDLLTRARPALITANNYTMALNYLLG